MNQSGRLLLSALCYIVLVGICLAGAMQALSKMATSSTLLVNRQSIERDGRKLVHLIRRTGRTALGCTTEVVGVQRELVCEVRFNGTNGAATFVRFIHTPDSQVFYQRRASATVAWTTDLIFDSITQFTVCTTADAIANTCAIEPNDLTDTTAPNRFFRYRIIQTVPVSNFVTKSHTWQSAFFVRNPSPFGPAVAFAR